MRTLTQVWVFFVSLTLAFLFIGFEIYGRLGLFTSFLLSLLLIYITLHKGLHFFNSRLHFTEVLGSDPTGFLSLLQELKNTYQVEKLHLYTTSEFIPPLVWKDYPHQGFILLHQDFLNHLNASEKNILAHFLLAHLKMRPTFRPRLLSVFEFSFLRLQFLLTPIISLLAIILGTARYALNADILSLKKSNVLPLEFGYFLKKMHDLRFHRAPNLNGIEYFSVLTAGHHTTINNFGQPSLKKRLNRIIGFIP